MPYYHEENIMDNIPDNNFVENNISFRPEETILKIWQKLVLNQIKFLFSEKYTTDMILNRMRNIHAVKVIRIREKS